MDLLIVALSAVAGGLVQAVTGFGSGIVMMLFLPFLLPVLNASALSATITLAATGGMSWQYRKKVHKDLILLPGISYTAASALAIGIANDIDAQKVLRLFGLFLILLSVFFLFFSARIHIRATPLTAIVCAALSGVAAGLFGIGGPPMVLYYLAALDDKESYLGTIQSFFLITGLFTFGFRVYQGLYTGSLLLPTAVGMAGILAGKSIGGRIINRIDSNLMRKIIYVFLGFTGVVNLLK